MCDKTQEEAQAEAMGEIQKLRDANSEEGGVLTVGPASTGIPWRPS